MQDLPKPFAQHIEYRLIGQSNFDQLLGGNKFTELQSAKLRFSAGMGLEILELDRRGLMA